MTRHASMLTALAFCLLLTADSALAQTAGAALSSLASHATLVSTDNVASTETAPPASKDASKTRMTVTSAFQTETVQPENGEVGVLFVLSRKASVTIALTDEHGTELCPSMTSTYPRGMHRATVSTRHLEPGMYHLTVTTEGLTRVKPFNVR
jgi:hypothetical protein